MGGVPLKTFELKVTAPPVVGALTSQDLEYVVSRIGHHRFLSSSSSSLTVLRSKLFEACKTMAYISQILHNFFELSSLNICMDEDGRSSIGIIRVLSFISRHSLESFDDNSYVEIKFDARSESREYYRVRVWRGDRMCVDRVYEVKDHIYSYDMNFPTPSEFAYMIARALTEERI